MNAYNSLSTPAWFSHDPLLFELARGNVADGGSYWRSAGEPQKQRSSTIQSQRSSTIHSLYLHFSLLSLQHSNTF